MGKKFGELIGLEWLAERFPAAAAAVTGRPLLSVETRDGLVHISDGSRSLATTDAGRRTLYKRGISARIARLLSTYQIPDDLIRPGDVVVNFGANIGEMALAMHERGAEVVAIEPDPLTLRCLRLNTAGANVQIVPNGAWHTDGPVTFYQAPETADTSAINQSARPIVVEAQRLDTILSNTPGRIRLLVGDAEGAEPEVLGGAAETLARVDYVAIAAGRERNGESTTEAVTSILRAASFDVAGVSKHGYILAVSSACA